MNTFELNQMMWDASHRGRIPLDTAFTVIGNLQNEIRMLKKYQTDIDTYADALETKITV